MLPPHDVRDVLRRLVWEPFALALTKSLELGSVERCGVVEALGENVPIPASPAGAGIESEEAVLCQNAIYFGIVSDFSFYAYPGYAVFWPVSP